VPAQYPVALKPAAGWECQLWVSPLGHTQPAEFTMLGVNSGVATYNVADAALLATNQQELAVALMDPIYAAGNVVVTVTGTDQFAAAYTGVGTFKPPAWSQNQERQFPRGWAVDLVPTTAGQKCAAITGISVVADAQAVSGQPRLAIFGVPSFSTAPLPPGTYTAGAYQLVSDKTSLNWVPRTPEAHAVASGRDRSKYVKLGEIPVGQLEISTKVGSQGDGLMRYNGVRGTGVVVEKKERTVETSRTYLLGLVLTAKPNTGESVEDVTATGMGMYQEDLLMIAP